MKLRSGSPCKQHDGIEALRWLLPIVGGEHEPISSDREADRVTSLRDQMVHGDASGLRASLTLQKTPLTLKVA